MNGANRKSAGTAVFSALLAVLVFCGCSSSISKLDTLDDYTATFVPESRVSLRGKKYLTLSEARETALANNPTLRAALSSIRSAKYSYYRALSAWSPEITASWETRHTDSRGYDLREPPAGIFPEERRLSNAGSLRATWLLFNGFERELNILSSRAEYEYNISAADDVKRLLLRAVMYAWCDILLASEEIKIFRADRSFQDAALRQAEQQFKSGHISYATVLNFKIRSSKAQSRVTLAEYERQTALDALAALLGYSINDFPRDIKLQTMPPQRMELYHELAFYLEQAVLNRPDLKAEKAEYERCYRRRQAAYSAFLPEIYLFADMSFDSASAKYGDYKVKSSYYNHPSLSFGVTGKWNIFRGFDSWNELRRRKALEQTALWGLNRKFLDVTTEVRDALEHCRNSCIQIGIFREMAEWVTEQRDLIYSEYINGRETIARVNQAQSELVEAQSSLALWHVRSRKAFAQLNAALGKDAIPPPEL